MRKLDISSMTSKDLNVLVEQINAELESRAEKDKAIEEVKKLAEAKGLKLEDILAELGGARAKPGKSRGVVPVKFRHPKDPTLTWTGRGKQPNWFKEALAAGYSEQRLAV